MPCPTSVSRPEVISVGIIHAKTQISLGRTRANARWNVDRSPLAGRGYLFGMRADSCPWPLSLSRYALTVLVQEPRKNAASFGQDAQFFPRCRDSAMHSRNKMSMKIVFASKAIFIGDDISARLGAKDAFNR